MGFDIFNFFNLSDEIIVKPHKAGYSKPDINGFYHAKNE